MWLVDQGALTAARRTLLQREVTGLGSLQEVVRWGFSCSPPRDVAAVVIQDEYSHDVVLPWLEGVYLAFDTT